MTNSTKPPAWGPEYMNGSYERPTTDQAPDPWGAPRSFDEPQRRPSKKRAGAIAASALVAILTIGGVGYQFLPSSSAASTAQSPGGQRMGGGGLAGSITAIDGNIVTIAAQSRGFGNNASSSTSTNVTTSDGTTYLTGTTGSLSDIKVGENVSVNGTTSSSTVTATRISDYGSVDVSTFSGAFDGGGLGGGNLPPSGNMPTGNAPSGKAPSGGSNMGTPPDMDGDDDGDGGRGAMGGPSTTGTVKSVSGSTVVVSTDAGDVTVNATGNTAVTLYTKAAASDLHVGSSISVNGNTADDGAVMAILIRIGDEQSQGVQAVAAAS